MSAIARDALKRLGEHEHGSRWADRIKRVDIEQHPTREAAFEAERIAIRDEAPECNVADRRAYRNWFDESLVRLGLSQMAAARLLGVDGRTVRAWIAGDARIPGSTAILVRLALSGRIALQDIEAVAEKPKPRK